MRPKKKNEFDAQKPVNQRFTGLIGKNEITGEVKQLTAILTGKADYERVRRQMSKHKHDECFFLRIIVGTEKWEILWAD